MISGSSYAPRVRVVRIRGGGLSAPLEVPLLERPGAAGGGGAFVWDASRALAAYLVRDVGAVALSRVRVLELGAGCGLPALTAARLGALGATLTDRSPAALELAQRGAMASGTSVAVAEFDFGGALRRLPPSALPVDLVLLSDVLGLGECNFAPLVKTLEDLDRLRERERERGGAGGGGPRLRALMSYRRRAAFEGAFFALLAERGFVCREARVFATSVGFGGGGSDGRGGGDGGDGGDDALAVDADANEIACREESWEAPISIFEIERGAVPLPAPPREARVLYAAYGSNLLQRRFLAYLQGGRIEGNNLLFAACASDASAPRSSCALWLRGSRLRFARAAAAWGGGGVGFLELTDATTEAGAGAAPALTPGLTLVDGIAAGTDAASATLMRCYDVGLDQFIHVVAAENRGAVALSAEVVSALAHRGAGASMSVAMTAGAWYSNCVCLGTHRGLPVLTFTTEAQGALRAGEGSWAPSAPSAGYRAVVEEGLRECGLGEAEARRYVDARQ